jgi:hypothetical protein
MEGGGGGKARTQNEKRLVEIRDQVLAGPYLGRREWKNVPDAECQAGGFVEFLIATNWIVLQLEGRSTYTQNVWSKYAMDQVLAGPYLGREWKNVQCARCGVPGGGLRRISDRDELASAAVGGAKHAHAKRVVAKYAMADLLPGPCWPLLWARVTAGAETRIQTSDFDMAAALLRALRGMWRQSFGSDFVFWAAGARPQVLRGRHFTVLAVLKKKIPNHTGYKNSANPLLSAVFFRPSLLPWSPGRAFYFPLGGLEPCAPAGPIRSSSDVCGGGVVRTHGAGEREVGAPNNTTRRPTMHMLVAGKAHHRSGTSHIRHIGVDKGKPHV